MSFFSNNWKCITASPKQYYPQGLKSGILEKSMENYKVTKFPALEKEWKMKIKSSKNELEGNC